MKLLKNHTIFSLLNSYSIDSAQPVNNSYLWNFGSLLGIGLVIKIITEIILVMHYTPSIDAALISVEHIMRAVNYGWLTISQTIITNTMFLTDGINIESIQSAPLFPFFFLKINNTGKAIVDYVNSFDIIKGIKYAAAFPVLPLSIANYHKSLLGRTLRVIGGLAAIITLTYNTDLAIIHTKNSIFYVTAFIGLSHMLYITFILSIKSAYVLYYILTGKWIHRNSPLKYFLTEGSAAFYCFTGICFVSGSWLGLAGTAITVDQLIGEDYFKEMAVFKQPALLLKSTFETLDESIYFGNKGSNLESQQPTIKDNFNLNENGIRQNSDILNKLHHQQEEFDKLKSKIASNPEIKQAFDKIKKELHVDIVKDIDGIFKLVKK